MFDKVVLGRGICVAVIGVGASKLLLECGVGIAALWVLAQIVTEHDSLTPAVTSPYYKAEVMSALLLWSLGKKGSLVRYTFRHVFIPHCSECVDDSG